MDAIAPFLAKYASHAHWFILGALLLAGCNIPISIDFLLILAAFLAIKFVPEHFWILYSTLLIGCSLSAYIAFFLGKKLGHVLKRYQLFRSILSEKRMSSMQKFYRKYGIWTFIIGRFIPFGVRNALFMSSGLSLMPFSRFLLLDAIACFIWVTAVFHISVHFGHNIDTFWPYIKKINGYVFFAFLLTGIILIWYKRLSRTRSHKIRLL